MSESFTIEEIRALLKMLEEHEVTEFKLERGGEKIWLKRGQELQLSAMAQQSMAGQPQFAPPMNAPARMPLQAAEDLTLMHQPAAPLPPQQEVAARPAGNIKEITSPMVGTFYRKPAVDAQPYVDVGDTVKKGDVLCIVEAMKLMNEIEADVSGKIVEVCLEDGQMVEFGEVLFRIEAF